MLGINVFDTYSFEELNLLSYINHKATKANGYVSKEYDHRSIRYTDELDAKSKSLLDRVKCERI